MKINSFDIFKQVAIAFQFLTIIPLKTRWNLSETEIARSSVFFPLIGAFQGIILSFSCIILNFIFSSYLTSGIIILIYVLMNGGFHLDGLSDTCDALSVKSTGNPEHDIKKRLLAMKDSSVGAVGAVAISLSILLKYLLFRELFLAGRQINPYIILFLMPVFTKWAMVQSMGMGKSAKAEGLGNIFIRNLRTRDIVFSTVNAILLSMFAYYIFLFVTSQFVDTSPASHTISFLIFCAVELLVLFALCFLLSRWFTKKFGGMTGDNLGAIHEVSEFIFLITALLWI